MYMYIYIYIYLHINIYKAPYLYVPVVAEYKPEFGAIFEQYLGDYIHW